jgi:hypothetical protein
MTPAAWRVRPETLFRGVIIGGFLLMAAANLPGHMSFDSVVELYEGRHHLHHTWAPAAYAAVLAAFDAILPGTGLYVTASGLLLFGALSSLRRLAPAMSWGGPLLALLIVLTPHLLVYQAIVWKDVLFANLAVASFVLLAHVAAHWDEEGPGWCALAAIVLMLALAAQVRQNGLIAAGFAALVLAWAVRKGGWRASLAWGGGGLVATVLVSQAIALAAQPAGAGPDHANARGLRILQQYDIIGAVAHDKAANLAEIKAFSPGIEQVIRTRAVPLYSPEKVDYLERDPAMIGLLWKLPSGVVARQWRGLIAHDPGAYLAQRWDAFRWVFLTPALDRCLPIYTGVDGPPAKLADLQILSLTDPADQALYDYSARFFATPVYSHLTYAVIAALVAGLLLSRRSPADMAIVGLMASALAFTGSFFVISIACDYRYLYFLDLAALTGLLYLAIHPPLRELGLSRRRGGARGPGLHPR